MAKRARVELRTGLTHHGNGRVFKKGQPQILSNLADIRYYQQEGSFVVTVLGETPAPVAKTSAPKPSPKPAAEPIPETAEPEELDDEEDDEEDDEDSDNDYTRAELAVMRKAELVDVCKELGLDTVGTVKELTERILDAQ